VGKSAYTLAEKYWTGAISSETIQAAITMLPGGNVKVAWNATRGMYHKVQSSADLVAWTDVAPAAVAYDTNGAWTDVAPLPGRKSYRVVRSTTP
jgi:hypothetical protein